MNFSILVQEYARGALREPRQFLTSYPDRTCTVCDYTGRFLSVGPRPESRCPNCSSKERDRIMGLYLRRHGIDMHGKTLLHFSAERPFYRRWKDLPGYVAGDVKESRVANAVVDVTKIQFGDGHFDYLICHHVLEHVPDDATGMKECYRVLKSGGRAFFSVPLDAEKPQTWEPPADMQVAEVERICGRHHVRLYGRDFGDKLAAAGFTVDTIAFTPEEGDRHRLTERHGGPSQGLDRIFVCSKP